MHTCVYFLIVFLFCSFFNFILFPNIIFLYDSHPYSTETNHRCSISSAEKPDELLFYVDTTITNKTQPKIPKLRKLTVENDPLAAIL